MYDFHYNFIKKNLMLNSCLLITYKINWKDVYEEFFKHKHLFDLIDYQSNVLNPTNKKVIGKMKDDYKGTPINKFVRLKSNIVPVNKFVGLESKIYSIVSGNSSIEYNKNKNILFQKKMRRDEMKRIQSKKHKIGTYEVNKISLSCFDDKRLILDDRITTLAYFHKDIKFLQPILNNNFVKIMKLFWKIFTDSHR